LVNQWIFRAKNSHGTNVFDLRTANFQRGF
jgi:hypothetical protein